MLQKHILEVKKQNVANQSEMEELEQFRRSQCLTFESVSIEKNETSDKVLKKVMDLCKEAGANILYRVVDATHRIGAAYADNKKKI